MGGMYLEGGVQREMHPREVANERGESKEGSKRHGRKERDPSSPYTFAVASFLF
jgi:hypothetical protein